MFRLTIDILDDGKIIKSKSDLVFTINSEEFITAMVSLCNKLGVTDIPVWTSTEERLLKKKCEVFIEENSHCLKISISSVGAKARKNIPSKAEADI